MKKKGLALLVLIIVVIVLAILTTIIITQLEKNDIINESKDVIEIENINRAADYARLVNDDIEVNLARGINILPSDVTRVTYIQNKLRENNFSDELISKLSITEDGEVSIVN